MEGFRELRNSGELKHIVSYGQRPDPPPGVRGCLLVVLVLLNFAYACHGPANKDNKYFSVTKVVDGDTFWVDDGTDRGRKVRLIGVDAPETRSSARKSVGHYGTESKEYLTRLLRGKKVRLEFDADRTDRYGRTLAYVYLEDGTFVNAELLRGGYAMVLTVPPNVKFAEEFRRLQSEARNNARGLWAR